MAPFHLLTPDAQYADDGVIERQTAGGDVDWDIRRARALSELPPELLAACDALVVWHEMKIDAAFVSALRRCRIVVRAGVGFDHIDLAAAAAAGIPVCNTPDYGTSEVADHAIGLMLALRRGIVSYHQNWSPIRLPASTTREPRWSGACADASSAWSASDASALQPPSAPRPLA